MLQTIDKIHGLQAVLQCLDTIYDRSKLEYDSQLRLLPLLQWHVHKLLRVSKLCHQSHSVSDLRRVANIHAMVHV